LPPASQEFCPQYHSYASPFKFPKRLTYTRVEPIINPQLPIEEAGYQHRRSIVDQVTLLTQDIAKTFWHMTPPYGT